MLTVDSLVPALEPAGGAELAADERLGCYRIVRFVAQGSMGRVYEVQHATLGRRFALKVLQPKYRLDADVRRRFRREAEIGARLESAHLAAVLDYDVEARDWPYIVLEYVDGRSLTELLRAEGSLPLRRVARIVSQLASGLGVAHSQGIVHRDLKPSNVLVCRDAEGLDHCKIVDFGVAKTGGSELGEPSLGTAVGALIGTVAYMAPEQLRGETDLDSRVDVYALGAIAHECLSGQRLARGSTPHELMYQLVHRGPTPLAELRPDLPLPVCRAVDRAVSVDRRARHASAPELADALRQAVDAAREMSELPPDTPRQLEPLPAESSPALAPRRAWRGLVGAGALTLCLLAFALGRRSVQQPVALASQLAEARPPPLAPRGESTPSASPPALAVPSPALAVSPPMLPSSAARAQLDARAPVLPQPVRSVPQAPVKRRHVTPASPSVERSPAEAPVPLERFRLENPYKRSSPP